jgi:hypothetical protein
MNDKFIKHQIDFCKIFRPYKNFGKKNVHSFDLTGVVRFKLNQPNSVKYVFLVLGNIYKDVLPSERYYMVYSNNHQIEDISAVRNGKLINIIDFIEANEKMLSDDILSIFLFNLDKFR